MKYERLHASGTVVGAKCERLRASGTCMTVSASHTSVIPAHLLAVCVLSGRRALGGAARCTTVSASRALEQASRIRRRVDVPSRHQVAEQHLVESGRRVRLMSRIVDVVELSGLERFSILSITIVVTIVVKDEDSLTTQTSAQNYPFQESRWKRPVRTSFAVP